MKLSRAVFFDRDGVLNRSLVVKGKPVAPLCLEDFEILPEAIDATRLLKLAGFRIVIFTNQPEVGRGSVSWEAIQNMHSVLRQHISVDHIEVCIHDDRDECLCRKPKPGMILNASDVLQIDLSRSYVVGDRWRDIESGKAAGCATVWIDRGYDEIKPLDPNWVVQSTLEAAEVIVGRE